MLYTVYQITNDINGKTYIGCHKTKDINDEYMGSGKYLTHSQNYHGIENFSKDVLFAFDNANDMFSKEAELVNEKFIKRDDTYNIKLGGYGGFDFINKNGLNNSNDNHIKGTLGIIKSRKETPERWAKADAAAGKRMKSYHEQGLIKYGISFAGKTHTDEAKRKIGLKTSIAQAGSGNSQYGTMWIYNLDEKKNKKIKKTDLDKYLEHDWIAGRKMKFS